MRRADRLFEIIEILRRQRGRALTAHAIADELEVSVRTIYRDIAALQARRVPIVGEPGVGYVLRDGHDFPPLMLTESELEAIVLGARVAQSWADSELGRAADSLLAKVEAVLPDHLRRVILDSTIYSPRFRDGPAIRVDLAALRRAGRQREILEIVYADEQGRPSTRRIWPLAISFLGPVWLVMAWCELREDFRTFRVDRMESATPCGERFPAMPGRRLQDYIAREEAACARRNAIAAE